MFKLYMEKETVNVLKELKNITQKEDKYLLAYSCIKDIDLDKLKYDNYENMHYIEKRDEIDLLFDFSSVLLENMDFQREFNNLTKNCYNYTLQVKPSLEGIVDEVNNQVYYK